MSIDGHPGWLAAAKRFSDADLPHPNTGAVMGCFSKDAIFEETGRYSVGKTLATIGFKIGCEWSVKEVKLLGTPQFEDKKDHILWSFKSIQRRGLLPEMVSSGTCYRVDYSAKLYFDDYDMISRIETIRSIWTEEPAETR